MDSNNFGQERIEENADLSLLHNDAKFVQEANNIFKNPQLHGFFDDLLRRYLSANVPNLFTASMDPFNVVYDESKISMILFQPLTTILCGANQNFSRLGEILGCSTVRVGLCGKVFKNGEPTYTCRECAADGTCVMCFECFSASEHHGHKYKMATSKGNGYCDCGDEEAWNSAPFCEKHNPAAVSCAEREPKLPAAEDVKFQTVIRSLLLYIADVLCWEKYMDELPKGLEAQKLQLPYQTVLFNDESHTYDQVILALKHAIDCTQNQAMFLATTVDREGRSSVRSGQKDVCQAAKTVIKDRTSRNGKAPLTVEVADSNLIAHQTFALRLIAWIMQATQQFSPMVSIVSHSLCTDVHGGMELVKRLLLQDVKLWKSAREQIHQLLMATVLMDGKYRKEFSKMLAQLYADIMQGFIEDDHEHKVSVVSLTVQVFTVRSIAKMLVAEEDLFHCIFESLLLNCAPFKSKAGKLSFDRNQVSNKFRRALHLILDAKYLLNAPPPTEAEWSQPLRDGFIRGCSALLTFMNYMHGMDEVTRQTGTHQEFEPEWETAFNILIRLSSVITLMLQWCASDKQVQLAVYKAALTQFQNSLPTTKLEIAQAGHQVSCVVYDVAKQPVSVHTVLNRFLAGLWLNFGLLDGVSSAGESEPQNEFGGLTMSDFMEAPTRIQVLVAQVHAGMWRRNGYSLLNQIHNYFQPLLRGEMYDRDIVCLQICAAQMDSNEFLIRLVHKFGLRRWLEPPAQDSQNRDEDLTKQMVAIAEELLELLIVLMAERNVCGLRPVTREMWLRRELIHLLCKGPQPFSKLERHLVDEDDEIASVEATARAVADFRRPVSGTAGVFELKDECRREYSTFFYHYSRSDRSKAEQVQRKCRKDAESLDIRACPPPPCPAFSSRFAAVVNVMTCDVCLHILSVVLERTEANARNVSEGQLHRVIYLIGIALNEELRQRNEQPTDGAVFSFAMRGQQWRSPQRGLLDLLEACLHAPLALQHTDLLRWTIMRYREAVSLDVQLASLVASFDAMNATDRQASPDDVVEEERRKQRQAVAQQRRQKAMEQMAKLQKNFMKENAALFRSSNMKQDEEEEIANNTSDVDTRQQASGFPICVGPRQTTVAVAAAKHVTCILCQESQAITFQQRAVVLSALVQNSTHFTSTRGKTIVDKDTYEPLYASADMFLAPHTSTCGHVMHRDCWQQFFDAVVAREGHRPLRFRPPSAYDVDRGEYLCPLCKRISNTVLPLVPALNSLQHSDISRVEGTCADYVDWLVSLRQKCLVSSNKRRSSDQGTEASTSEPNVSKRSRQCPSARRRHSNESRNVCTDRAATVGAAAAAPIGQPTGWSAQVQEFFARVTSTMPPRMARQFFDKLMSSDPTQSLPISADNYQVFRTFSQAVYTTGLGVDPNEICPRVTVMSWLTTAYTIRCTEALLHLENKPLFGALTSRQKDCLYTLVPYAGLCNIVSSQPETKKHALNLLKCFFGDETSGQRSILDLDMFSTLVECVFAMPSLAAQREDEYMVPSGGQSEHFILRLTLTAHVVQRVFSYALSKDDTESDPSQPSRLTGCLTEFADWLLHLVGIKRSNIDQQEWACALQEGLRPFLAQSAMFFHVLTSVSPPEGLKDPSIDQWQLLLRFLDLPVNWDAFVALFDRSTIASWLGQPRSREIIAERRLVCQPVGLKRLIPLPHVFADLMNKAALFSCPSRVTDSSRAPTLCLVCGQLLCSSSFCCEKSLDDESVGACNYHSHSCSADVGMFLRIRDCQMVFLSHRFRGCNYQAPYVDEYGETDNGFRRGNPLFLSPDLYAKLERIWLHHDLQEEIVNQLEFNQNLMAIEWSHF